MSRKYFIVFIVLLFIPWVSASYVFQDLANTSQYIEESSGGGSCTNKNNIVDSNWGTYGYATPGGGTGLCIWQEKFIKPTDAINATIQIKIISTTKNSTINSSCWAFDSGNIYLEYQSYDNGATARATGKCKSSGGTDVTTNWPDGESIVMYQEYGGKNFYEMGIWWQINEAPTTPNSETLTTPIYVGSTLTATCSGSTDSDGDSLTYYYHFYNVEDAATRQAYSTTNTYTIVAADAHNTMRVYCKAYDGRVYSGEYSADRSVSNTVPTVPTGLSLTSGTIYYGDNITGTCSGSTDADSDSITYYYQFYNVNDAAIVKAYSTSNVYTTQITDASKTIRVYCKGYDSYGYGSELTADKDVSIRSTTSGLVYYNNFNGTIKDRIDTGINAYDFKNNLNANDTWGNNSGFCINCPSFDGNGAVFDGTNDLMNLSNSTINISISNISIVLIYKSTNNSPSPAWQYIFDMEGSTGSGTARPLGFASASGYVALTNTFTNNTQCTTINVSDGNYHTIIATRLGGNWTLATLYVDGTSCGTVYIESKVDSTSRIRLGTSFYNYGVGYYYSGTVRSLAIYDKILNSTEIAAWTNMTDVPKKTSFINYLNLSVGYDFKMNQNAKDIGIDGRNGICSGSDCPIYNGNGVYFDGNNRYINSTVNTSKYFNSSWSIFIKFRMLGSNSDGVLDLINTRTGSDVIGYIDYRISDYGTKYLIVGVNNGTNSSQLIGTEAGVTTKTIEIGTWYNLVTTFDRTNNNFSAYIDGVNLASKITNNFSALDKDLIIGALLQGGTLYDFNGTFEKIFIYNRSLTAKEILDLSYQYSNQTNVNEEDNKAMSFDNNSTIYVSNITYKGPFSYSFWAKYNTIHGIQVMLSSYYDSSLNAHKILSNAGIIYISGNVTSLNTTYTVQPNIWYHLVTVNNGTHQILYVNGEYEYSGAQVVSNGSYIVNIAKHPVSTTQYFNGSLDEVRIYDRELNSSEILSLYQSGAVSMGLNLSTTAYYTNSTNLTILASSNNLLSNSINCSVIANDSKVYCNKSGLVLTSGTSNQYTNITCTQTSALENDVKMYSTCNASSGNVYNSTNYTIFWDSILPTITLTYPASNNQSYNTTNNTIWFNYSCAHMNNYNTSYGNITCRNPDTSQIIQIQNLSNLTTNIRTSYKFSAPNNTLCNFTCYDSMTSSYLASEVRNMTIISPLTNESFYTTIRRINETFSSNLTFNFNGDEADCGIVLNDSEALTCTDDTGASPLNITCTPGTNIQENVSMFLQCNDTTRTFINSVNSTSFWIYVDNVVPVINKLYPLNSSTYYNISQIPFEIGFNDSNVWGVNVTCIDYDDNTTEYSNQTLNINQTVYNFSTHIQFNNTGLKQCTVTVADDHTDNNYKAGYATSQKFLGAGEDKIEVYMLDNKDKEIDKTKVEIIYDDRNTIKLNDLYIEQKEDRISPVFELDPLVAEGVDKEADKDIYWTVEYDGKIFSREEVSKIPGHVILVPNDNNWKNAQWYDAVDEYDESIVEKEIKGNKILYHAKIPAKEYYEKDGYIFRTKSIGGLNVDSITWNLTIVGGSNTTFYAYNAFNMSNISNFNLTINNGTGITNYSTTNGTLYVEFSNASLDWVFWSDDYWNEYQFSSIGGNLSSSYNFSMYQVMLNVNVSNRQDYTPVYNANITLKNNSGGFNYVNSTVTYGTLFYLNAGLNFSVNVTGSGIIENFTYYNTSAGNHTYNVYVTTNFTISLMDEFTEGAFNVSSPDSIEQYTYCDDGQVYKYTISNASNIYYYNFNCTYDKVKFIVVYPTDRYYRTLLPRSINSSNSNVTIWLINLDTTQVVYNTFQIYQLTSTYTNFNVYFKKNIAGEMYDITSDHINVEEKIGTYLMLGEQYTVEVEADTLAAYELGFYTADSSGDKVIRMFSFNFNATPTGSWNNNSWWVETDNSTTPARARVAYSSTGVLNATLYVYNETESTTNLLATSTLFTDTGVIYYAPNSTYENYSFILKLNISKASTTGENTQTVITPWRANELISFSWSDLGFTSEAEWKVFLGTFLMLLLCVVALVFTWNTADVGGIIFIAVAVTFRLFGWISISAGIAGLAVLISIVNFMKAKDRGRA